MKHNTIFRGYVIVTAAFLGGCVDSGDEVMRTASPDGRHEAVVVEQGGGATTSYWYDICVVPTGGKCTSPMTLVTIYDAARNSNAFGVNVRWASPFQVVVEYESAENVKRRDEEGMPPGEVRVELKAGVIDVNARPGSMRQQLNDARRREDFRLR